MRMTADYTKAQATADNFFNTVCMNHINYAKKTNESVIHILITNLSVSAWDILEIAKVKGYNARLIKSRTLVVEF